MLCLPRVWIDQVTCFSSVVAGVRLTSRTARNRRVSMMIRWISKIQISTLRREGSCRAQTGALGRKPASSVFAFDMRCSVVVIDDIPSQVHTRGSVAVLVFVCNDGCVLWCERFSITCPFSAVAVLCTVNAMCTLMAGPRTSTGKSGLL